MRSAILRGEEGPMLSRFSRLLQASSAALIVMIAGAAGATSTVWMATGHDSKIYGYDVSGNPLGVIADPGGPALTSLALVQGEVWAADNSTWRVLRFSTSGSLLGSFSTTDTVSDIEVVGAETWMTTGHDSRIYGFDPGGNPLGVVADPGGPAITALAMVGGEVWAADNSTWRVLRFSTSGSLLGSFSTTDTVSDIEVVGTETWMTTGHDSRIYGFDPGGNPLGVVADPGGPAITALAMVGGEVWAADNSTWRVLRFSSSGSLLGSFSTTDVVSDILVVPEPSAALLLCSGIIALSMMRFRRE